MSFFEYIISTIAPHLCLGCGTEGDLLCEHCRPALSVAAAGCVFCGHNTHHKTTIYICKQCQATTPLNNLAIATNYKGIAKELIHKLKFERAQAGARPIGHSIAERLILPPNPTAVTYIPTATKRVRQRGYDQSALIARRLSSDLGIPFASLLYRYGHERQLGQDRKTRQKQLKDVFWTNKTLANEHIILVDDVITTGSSMLAAAIILRNAGAASVFGAAFARAII